MARKTKVAAVKKVTRRKVNGKVANSFMGNYSGFFPQNQGSPWTEQVSNVNTGFKNLRWYLVSNFYQFLCELYAEIGLVQTIVDVPVDDGFRGGIKIESKQLDEEQVSEVLAALDRDDDLTTVAYASKWTRLFGGGGILILTDEDPAITFDINEVNENTNIQFRDVDLWELFFSTQNMGGYDPTIQAADVEYYNYYGVTVHKSRVINMIGIKPPSFIRPKMRGWGLSVVETLVRSMNQYLKATDLTFEVLDEFKLDVYKIKNLVNSLLSPDGGAKVRERVQTANYLKNYQNAIVMDSEDDYQSKQLSFAGLAEAQAGIRMQVASDMRMPLTKLFGISAAGFNSGEDDIEVYNAMVESQVRNKVKYPIMRIVEIKCKKLFGFVPDDIKISFEPLRVLSSEQEENVKDKKFTRALSALTAGAITVEEFRDICNRSNLFDIKVQDNGLDAGLTGYDSVEIIDTPLLEKDSSIEQLSTGRPGTARPLVPGAGGIPSGQIDQAAEKKEFEGDDPKYIAKARNQHESKEAPEAKEQVENSAAFDRASYEADGGDRTFDTRRKYFFEDPKDAGLWEKVKQRSIAAYGKENQPFMVWLYRKEGGKW